MTEEERFKNWLKENNLPQHAGMWEAWQAAREWISIKEELPPDRSEVLIVTFGEIYHTYVEDGIFYSDDPEVNFLVDDIKWWYPVPDLPRKEKSNEY